MRIGCILYKGITLYLVCVLEPISKLLDDEITVYLIVLYAYCNLWFACVCVV